MQYQQLKVILRWSWLLVLIPIVAALIAYVYMSAQPSDYEATSVLLVGTGIDSPSPDMDSLRAGAYLMGTYAELPRTDTFLEQLRTDLNLTSFTTRDLAQKIDVRVLVDTQIFKIVVKDDDPDRAVLIANGTAEQLQRLSPPLEFIQALRDRMESQATRIEQDIEETQVRLDEISRQLDIEQDDTRRAALLTQLAGEERRLSDSNQALVDLFQLIQLPITNSVVIVDPAEVATEVNTPVMLYTLLAAGAGLIISILLGVLLFSLEGNLITRDNASLAAGAPLWGVVSLVGEKKSQQLLNLDGASAPAFGQYHELTAQLLHQQAARNLNCLLIASVEQDNLASEVAANLAIALARTNRHVLLLDADMHSNFVERFFKLSNGSNLAQILYKPETSMAISPIGGIPQLAVLPSGSEADRAFDLVASPQMSSLLNKAATAADLVLVAAPSLMSAEEGLALAAYVDAVVLVAKERRTTQTRLRETIDRLETVGGRVAGVILTQGGWF
jgi:Mrp family chromosome partitioning ATPase